MQYWLHRRRKRADLHSYLSKSLLNVSTVCWTQIRRGMGMIKTTVFCAILVAGLGVGASNAATQTPGTTFSGNACTLGGQTDCAALGQGGDPGVYTLSLTGLRPDPMGEASFAFFAEQADLYDMFGANDPDQNFRFSIDGNEVGLLFDVNTTDEAAESQELADSVDGSIDAAEGSIDEMSLNFTLSQAEFAPLIADRALSIAFDFSGSTEPVTIFENVTFSVEYETASVPAQAPFLLLLAGLAGLGFVRRKGG